MKTHDAYTSVIEKKVSYLPPYLIKEVEDFIDFLLSKNKKRAVKSGRLSQKWAGALKEYKSKYTSSELQKMALQWR